MNGSHDASQSMSTVHQEKGYCYLSATGSDNAGGYLFGTVYNVRRMRVSSIGR